MGKARSHRLRAYTHVTDEARRNEVMVVPAPSPAWSIV
jgi:hypothetical protein